MSTRTKPNEATEPRPVRRRRDERPESPFLAWNFYDACPGDHAPAPEPTPDQLETPWQRIRSHRLIGALTTATTIAGFVCATSSQLPPTWMWPPIACVFAWVLLAHLGNYGLALALLVPVAAAGLVGAWMVYRHEARTRSERSKKELPAPPARQLPHRTIDLGAGIGQTVVSGDLAWSLTKDGRLVATALSGGDVFRRLAAPSHAKDLRICGPRLVVRTRDGHIVVFSARTGRRLRSYPAGPIATWTCSGQWAWLTAYRRFVRLDLRAPRRGALIKRIPGRWDIAAMAAAGNRVWTLTGDGRELFAWDRDQNMRYRGVTSDDARSLTLLHGRPYVLHPDAGCLRTLSRGTRTESEPGIRVGVGAGLIGGERDAVAVADPENRTLTIVTGAGKVERRRIALDALHMTDVDVTDRFVVIADSPGHRLVIVERDRLRDLPAPRRALGTGCR